MARVVNGTGERGAVYVEFIIAFLPLFLMFLAVCQLALIAAADALVRHGAYAAARSAVVVLEDSPQKFDGAPCGNLSEGNPAEVQGIDDLVSLLAIATASDASDLLRVGLSQLGDMAGIQNVARDLKSKAGTVPLGGAPQGSHGTEPSIAEAQPGARMSPIRAAAYLSLLPIAPSESATKPDSDTIGNSLGAVSGAQLAFALQYTKAATSVTLHDGPGRDALASEPVDVDATVTARVAYAYHCTVPVVRGLLCRSLERIVEANGSLRRAVTLLPRIVAAGSKYKVLTAEATLLNQGASYAREASDERR